MGGGFWGFMALLRHLPSAPPSVESSMSPIPQNPSVNTLLNRCTTLPLLHQIHSLIIRKGLTQHPVLISRFLLLASSLSSLPHLHSIFHEVAHPTLPLFNSLLKAHSDRRSPLPILLPLFTLLRRSSPDPPDRFSFPPLLKSCAHFSALQPGQSLHAASIHYGLDADIFLRTALIDFYGKCLDIEAAQKLFETMQYKSEVSWTAMLVGYLGFGDLGSARKLFDQMPVRNVVSYNAMIDGYAKAGDLVSAQRLFDEMPKRNAVTYTSMISGYARVGNMAMAGFLFERSEKRDVFLWSAMISGYAQNGWPEEAVRCFVEMNERRVEPDEFIVVGVMSACSQLSSLPLARWVDAYVARSSIDVKKVHVLAALIDMHAKCGNMERAVVLFESMVERDLVSYCSMMQGFSLHGHGAEAVELFARMLKEGVLPDDVAFTVALTACSYAGLVEEGSRYFELIRNRYFIIPSPYHYACMVDLLGRAGRLKEAYELIEKMPLEPHAGAWGAMLGACRLHGNIELGEIVAKRLFEVEPTNAANYVVLSDIYAAADKWEDVSQVRTTMTERGLRKIPGYTRTWV